MKYARKSRWALLYKFHRYTGLVIAIVIIVLAITGILLNHTDDLKLDKRFVHSEAILNWYGIEGNEPASAYSIAGQWITQLDRQIYLNDKPVLEIKAPFIGAAVNDAFIVAAFPSALILLSPDGEVIEQIDKSPIEKIAAGPNERIYIQSRNQVFFSDDGLLTWEISDQQNLNWSEPASLPASLKQQLKRDAQNQILPYERVLLDLHSGRIFGRFGVYVVDLTGIFLILLTISGCWIWIRHKLIQLRHRKP